MTTRVTGAAVLAALGLAATAAAGSARVTIFASQPVMSQGQQLVLSGSIGLNRANEIVTIQVKECGSTWFRGVAATRTLAGGGWTVDNVNPGVTAEIRAVWSGQVSAPVTVQQRASVFLRKSPPGSSTGFRVWSPRHFRKRVQIQRYSPRAGTWLTFRTIALDESPGLARFTVSLPRGTRVRAVLPLAQARPCYLAGTSNVLVT